MHDLPMPAPSSCTGSESHLVCVGASVRALACSAARAGWHVHAADLFGDRDLLSGVASFIRTAAPYPDSLVETALRFPDAPWCYTGALENHPDVVDRIAATRRLAGNPGSAIRMVRDHATLGPAVRRAGLAYPDTFTTARGLPVDGSFLRKPRASAGGRGIAPWYGNEDVTTDTGHLWQRRVDGAAWAVTFVCGRRHARIWGLSRQLVGCRWCHAGPFAYAGSISVRDAAVSHGVWTLCERLGAMLVAEFGLVGLVGVDIIIDRAEGVHVIEVNPRPTASMELVDRARGVSHAAAHLAACGVGSSAGEPDPVARPDTWGKAVLFASHDVVVDAHVDVRLATAAARWSRKDGWPAIADVPCLGARIAARRPLLTLFARGDTESSVHRTLRARATILTGAFSAGEAASL